MAKPRRKAFAPLPLSSGFYALLERTQKRLELGPSGGAALADAVAELSRAYTRDREQLAERAQGQSAIAARLSFFLPRDLVKIFGPMSELAGERRFPARERLRVLDVGAGLGATSLGLARWLAHEALPVEQIEVTAIEPDAQAARVLERLCAELPALGDEFAPIQLGVQTSSLQNARLEGSYDLILFGFVLNEMFAEAPLETRLSERAALLAQANARLRPGGALVVLEPALKSTTRELMGVRDRLAARGQAPFVFAPCLRSGPCPMLQDNRDWCHQELPYALPPKLAQVAQGAGLRYEGLTYANLVLTREPRARSTVQETERLYRVVSERLQTKGKLELYGCGESGHVRLMRLDRDESQQNSAFAAAERGQVLRVFSPEPRVRRETRVTREG